MSELIDLKSFRTDVFREKLITWFQINKRSLPWRNTDHWYPVFLSEFLLQQTQVEQALPYFEKFMNKYPDIDQLASASERDVLHLWAGLGYYSRARNMLKSAIRIRDDFNSQFPQSFHDAVSLPGIGNYTASAILSIEFNKNYAVVDGNVQRVITRIFAIPEDIRFHKTNHRIRQICNWLIDPNSPGDFNEAMMELGAIICMPKKPQCKKCPVDKQCKVLSMGKVEDYPLKSAPAPKKLWYQYVLVIRKEQDYLIVQRKPSGLLASLWEFPVIAAETFGHDLNEITELLNKTFGLKAVIIRLGPKFKHIYSHIKLHYIPVVIETKDKSEPRIEEYQDYSWVKNGSLENYPIHNAHKKIISWLNKSEVKTD